MSLRINTNVDAFNAHRNLEATSTAVSRSMERLSSGLRINRAADDAAGLAISEKLKGQIGGLDQAGRNVQDGISLVQTAEGSLTEVHSMLQRVRELAVQYQNGTLSTSDRSAISSEVGQLTQEIQRIGTTAQFNNIHLLDTAQTITFQVGANDGEVISVATVSLGGAVGTIDLTSSTVLADVDRAIDAVSTQRASFGAVEDRLSHTYSNLQTYEENLSASQSRITDVDMAAEMTNLTKNQILVQAGTAMLSQANQEPQAVLSLLH